MDSLRSGRNTLADAPAILSRGWGFIDLPVPSSNGRRDRLVGRGGHLYDLEKG